MTDTAPSNDAARGWGSRLAKAVVAPVTVADVVVATLKASGVRRVYGLPGDSINGFTDALIPESVVFLAIAPISGVLVSRVGPRWLMLSGILTVAAGFIWLSRAHPGAGCAEAILPGVVLWGHGIGIAVTPLTAAVLAAVSDLGEASAINDAASRVGGVIAIALVPVLIGATAGRGLAHALTHGYQPAMIVMAGLCAGGALIAGVFVSDDRAVAPQLAPHPRTHGCALPVPDPAAATA